MAELARAEPSVPALDAVRVRVDEALLGFLDGCRGELGAMDPASAMLAEELRRLSEAGGKRFRPAVCIWAFRAAGGPDGDAIVRAAAAIELLHLSALVHDDVMDRSDERRGGPATHVRFAKEAPPGADPDAYGTAVAILVGDLALVLSERLLRTSGFDGPRLELAMSRFDRMRMEMAAGQLLDVRGSEDIGRVAALKTASYTTEGPALIGAALAGAGPALEGPLRVFGRLLGEAFQLRDDVADDDAGPGAVARVDELVTRAERSLQDAPLEVEAASALVALARMLRLGAAG